MADLSNGYGRAAVAAVRAMAANPALSPREAWGRGVADIFPHSESARDKGCPRATFIGLCERGYVVNVLARSSGRRSLNAEYGCRAVDLLRNNLKLAQDPLALWRAVMGSVEKKHNSQMHVVIALWLQNLVK